MKTNTIRTVATTLTTVSAATVAYFMKKQYDISKENLNETKRLIDISIEQFSRIQLGTKWSENYLKTFIYDYPKVDP